MRDTEIQIISKCQPYKVSFIILSNRKDTNLKSSTIATVAAVLYPCYCV